MILVLGGCRFHSASPMAQLKSLPAGQETQETRAPSLVQDDPLEEGLAARSSILAWRIHGQRSLAGYRP